MRSLQHRFSAMDEEIGVRRSSRARKVIEVDEWWKEELGEEEEQEEEEHEESGKRKKTDNDDADFGAGDGDSDYDEDDGEEQEQMPIDPPIERNQTRLFTGGNEEGSIYHLPSPIVQMLLQDLNSSTLLKLRMSSRIMYHACTAVLDLRSANRFGDGATVGFLVMRKCLRKAGAERAAKESYRRKKQMELNKGEAKEMFALSDRALTTVRHRVEYHHTYRRRWEEHLFNVDELIKACVKRHGSFAKFRNYRWKRSRRREKKRSKTKQ